MTISEDEIEAAGQTPKRTRTDEGTVEERPIDELIKADQYAAGKQSVTGVPWGMRIARTKPGGTVG